MPLCCLFQWFATFNAHFSWTKNPVGATKSHFPFKNIAILNCYLSSFYLYATFQLICCFSLLIKNKYKEKNDIYYKIVLYFWQRVILFAFRVRHPLQQRMKQMISSDNLKQAMNVFFLFSLPWSAVIFVF